MLFVCVCVHIVSTCCCCCILAVSVVISCALSPAWLSSRRSCFLRSGSDSEARSTGRLRSRIWAHNSSFCFCRRSTSDWLSCTDPHKYAFLIRKHFIHPPAQRVCVCLQSIQIQRRLNCLVLLQDALAGFTTLEVKWKHSNTQEERHENWTRGEKPPVS